ncbi:MAG: alpha/beta hydrolase-fold protein [Proteobacteria bacterium]|nr:alpha/beta hydrolase-fold protein [Pseudomonadota bacterium]
MRLTINYPLTRGQLVLRTAADWDRDVLPYATSETHACFEVDVVGPTLEVKPVLRLGTPSAGEVIWAKGTNYVVTSHEPDRVLWPWFFGEERGQLSPLRELEFEGVTRSVRIYLPPGYDDNTLRRFPVLYMQDGQNLFCSSEAFLGNEWQVDETMDRLAQMNAIRKAIVVGIWPADRERDYTHPGYGAYGRFIVEQLKPQIDAEFRTRPGAEDTVTMGSSLGGVAALHLAWTYPQVFGRVACLSSTFGVFDDLFERIAREPRRELLIYMDSGWPKDNYGATNAMRDLLVSRGYRLGVDLVQFSFPEGQHTERSWSERIHVPFQYFFGRAWLAQRGQDW